MDRVRDVFGLAFSLALLSLVSCDVLSMGSMINWEDKSTNNVFDVMTRFNLYGCYCGFGGQGRPLDKIDCCCQAHDECYDRLASDRICQGGDAGVGMVYKYTKTNNDGKHNIECKPSSNQCAQEVCECDKALADCFSENEPSYNKAHRNYDRKKKCDSQKGLRAEFCPNFNE